MTAEVAVAVLFLKIYVLLTALTVAVLFSKDLCFISRNDSDSGYSVFF